MSHSIRQIRDNCLKARHLMQRSRQQHFAVGAFNIDNQETLIAIARAAQAKKLSSTYRSERWGSKSNGSREHPGSSR